MSSLIKSGLEEAVKQLPEDYAIKAESLPNALKKMGVKDEELKWSGVELPKEGKVSKEQLVEMEKARKDVFGVQESKEFNDYSISWKGGSKANPTAKRRVYTFKQKKKGQTSGDSRYTSAYHFPEIPDYLYHTATFRGKVNGKDTHIVEEIQSDLHQQGRQIGYGKQGKFKDLTDDEIREFEYNVISAYEDTGKAQDNAFDYLSRYGITSFEELDAAVGIGGPYSKPIPTSPYEKDWLKKAIEREVSNAIDEGAEQLAIPISGMQLDSLQRSAGVQQWYNTSVLDTARKVAKQNGLEFEEVSVYSKRDDLKEIRRQLEQSIIYAWRNKKDIRQELDSFDSLTKEDKDMVIAETEKFLANPDSNLQDLLNDITDKLPEEEAVKYAIIRPVGSAAFDASEESIRSAVLSGANPAEAIKSLGFTRQDIVDAMPEKSATLMQAVLQEPDTLIKNLQNIANNKKPLKLPSFSLYSSAGAGIASIYLKMKEGYTKEEIDKELEKMEYDQTEIEMVHTKLAKMKRAEEMGYPVEEIFKQIEKDEPKIAPIEVQPNNEVILPDEESVVGKAYRSLMGAEDMSAKELVAKLKVIGEDKSLITTDLIDYASDKQGLRRKEQLAKASEERIKAMSAKYGLELEVVDGEYWAKTEDGPVKVEPGFWQSFWEAKGETVLGTGGAISGGIAGAKAGLRLAPGNAYAKGIGVLTGSVLGAALGSAGGTQLDYLHNAITLNEDLNAEIMAGKALSSAEMSVVVDMATLGAFKLGKSSWHSIVKAKDFVQNGMFNRARTALKEQLFLTDEAADELVERLARVSDIPTGNKTDQQIIASTLTKPGAEGLVKASASIDPKASAAVAQAIDARAKDLLTATDKLTSSNIGGLLKNEVLAYESAVKENFGRVKSIAAQQPKVGNVKFKYDQLMLEPVLERLGKNIEDPTVAYKFMAQAQRIRDMSTTRGFTDLLELRQLVNDFKFNKRITNTKDFRMLDNVLTRIDNTIEQSSHYVFDDPKLWLSEYKQANSQYAKMMAMRKNTLMKIINKPGVSDKAIAQALTKYSGSVDDTFHEVLQTMPRATRAKVEGAVIDTLANKYTAGREGGMRATHFPMLAKELNGITFTTQEARLTKKAITELADVFMNDVPLAQSTGNIQMPKFQSFLTTDPVVRAKYEIASGLFNWIKTLAPSSQARTQALIRRTAKVLENPIHSKSINELKEELAGQVNIDDQLNKLAVEFTKQKAAGGGMPRVKLYGNGKVLTTKGTGTEHSIPIHRIAMVDTVNEVAESLGINKADKKSLDAALRDRGYKAIQLGTESIRLID